MQKLQLYIGGERLDLFDDETVSMTQSIQNIKDIEKVFTEFTQPFTVPASSINNKIFKHYYNFDISNGYDARQKSSASIELNFIPFKTGYIQLNGVELKKNLPYAYKITFYGNTINLKDVLGESELSSLTFPNSLNLPYNYTNIESKMTNGLQSIIAPLITHTQRLFYNSHSSAHNTAGNLHYHSSNSTNGVLWSDLKYAIRLYEIIQAIETTYPSIDFSTDFFSTTNPTFYNLYMWLHRKSGAVASEEQTTTNWVLVDTWTQQNTGTAMVTKVGANIIVDTTLAFKGLIDCSVSISPDDPSIKYDIRILRNGQTYFEKFNQEDVFNLSQIFPSGTYTIELNSADTLEFTQGNIEFTFTGETDTIPSVPFTNVLTNSNLIDSLSSELYFVISQQIPEMKIIDFLTGLFKMFNLTAYVDGAGTIVVRTLDSYYADRVNNSSGGNFDINKYLDITKSTVDVALPFRQVNFKYKGTKTFLANQYTESNGIGWGELRYTQDGQDFDAPNTEYNLEAPFEHMMFERLSDQNPSLAPATFGSTTIQYGFFVDSNQQPYFGEPLIFYAVNASATPPNLVTPIYLKSASNSGTSESAYIIPSNSLAIESSTSTKNLNYSLEINEYTGDSTFTGTLFEEEYKTYISDVFSTRRRITNVSAFMPLKVLYGLQMNDYITIGQQSYKINSITTDLTNGKSSLELLNNVQ
jgi:hypothetical protein